MKKILLVDDSKVVGKLLTTTLTDSGFTVINCTDVDTAIAAHKENGLSIGLVITDLIMPGKDGNDFIDYLHASSVPGTRPKIIVISGGSKGTVTAETAVQSVKDRVEMVLVKPFKPEQLIIAVKTQMGT